MAANFSGRNTKQPKSTIDYDFLELGWLLVKAGDYRVQVYFLRQTVLFIFLKLWIWVTNR